MRGDLDADEDLEDVGLDHQGHQLRIIGQVDAGFCGEFQRVAVLLLPVDQDVQQLLGLRLVTDEIVVDQEAAGEALRAHGLELGDHLLVALEPGPAAEDGDDVAKLAQERTTPRELHRCERVAFGLDQVEARRRHRLHVGLVLLLVALEHRLAAGERGQELRPGLLGFADEASVAEIDELGFRHRAVRTADDDRRFLAAQLQQDLVHAPRLHDHAGDADDIEAVEIVEVDLLDVLVEQLDAAMRRDERGQGRQSSADDVAALLAGLER